MKQKEPFIINININWHLLVVLGVVVGVLVLGYSVAGAQNSTSPNINDASQKTPVTDAPHSSPVIQNGNPPNANDPSLQLLSTNAPESSPVTPPGPADLKCADDLLPSTVGQCVPADLVTKPSSSVNGNAGTTAFVGTKGHYYVTKDYSYRTNAALTACGTGYHMASLWELLDVSHLTYDYNNPAAQTSADSGYGPPSSWNGWVQTGYSSSTSATTGQGNCAAWTSIANTDNGVAVQLSWDWVSAPGNIVPWVTTSYACNFTGPVWCIGN